MDCNEEKWVDIEGFEGFYRVSNLGRVMSKKKGYWNILSIKNSRGDYLSVVLKRNNKDKHSLSIKVYRLVYLSFVGQIPKGKKYHIHHIDGNKQNNNVNNLKLVNSSEHHKIHIAENPLMLSGLVRYNKYDKTKAIMQFDLDGNYIKTYLNGVEASKETGICRRNILQVANKEPYNKNGNVRKQAGGFIWRFAK